tara:strand:+ start:1533 stop:1706 length:174 start_codon:yes stop_codon:yes gene_type:complete
MDKTKHDLEILKNFVTPLPLRKSTISTNDRMFNEFTMKYIGLQNTINLMGAQNMLQA